VAPRGVAVVTVLRRGDHAVATERNALSAGHTALPAGLDRRAVSGAAVAAHGVPVVAGFGAGQHAVAADPARDAGCAEGGAIEVRLDLTEWVAAVAAGLVRVVALLALVRHAVAAVRGQLLGRDDGDVAAAARTAAAPAAAPAAGVAAGVGIRCAAASEGGTQNKDHDRTQAGPHSVHGLSIVRRSRVRSKLPLDKNEKFRGSGSRDWVARGVT